MNSHEARSILLVEDSPVDTFLLCNALAKLPGIRVPVLQTERLRDALALLQGGAIDLILTDLNLPDSFGLETVRALVEAAGGIPILALIGDSAANNEAQLLKAGACGQIFKDHINDPIFAESIEHALQGKAAGCS
jgi:CheY-like chemotaxis protein